MPKRPTMRARAAEKKLLDLLGDTPGNGDEPLPPVRQLGEQLGLSYATISRLLQRFAQEGRAWQHPNGRFFPVHASQNAVKGLPIVVIGRQIQHWSRLYQEIIAGVSEVCTMNGCPLVFLSSEKLVCHESPEYPPLFASSKTQESELCRLASTMPRLCAGLLFDHLWEDRLISAAPLSSIPRLLLARPSSRPDLLATAPDFAAGARLILEHLGKLGCANLYLGVPFAGDPAVDSAAQALYEATATGAFLTTNIKPIDCSTPTKRKSAIARLGRLRSPAAIVCTEDNVASFLWQGLIDAGLQNSKNIQLVSMQGTGALNAPITHLHYDYRQLGRSAVTALLEHRRDNQFILPQIHIEGVAGQ